MNERERRTALIIPLDPNWTLPSDEEIAAASSLGEVGSIGIKDGDGLMCSSPGDVAVSLSRAKL